MVTFRTRLCFKTFKRKAQRRPINALMLSETCSPMMILNKYSLFLHAWRGRLTFWKILSCKHQFQAMFRWEFMWITCCQGNNCFNNIVSCTVENVNNDANIIFVHACFRDWIYKCIQLEVETAEFFIFRPPVVYLFSGSNSCRFLHTVQWLK